MTWLDRAQEFYYPSERKVFNHVSNLKKLKIHKQDCTTKLTSHNLHVFLNFAHATLFSISKNFIRSHASRNTLSISLQPISVRSKHHFHWLALQYLYIKHYIFWLWKCMQPHEHACKNQFVNWIPTNSLKGTIVQLWNSLHFLGFPINFILHQILLCRSLAISIP